MRLSSWEVVFLLGRLPARSSSCEDTPVRLSSISNPPYKGLVRIFSLNFKFDTFPGEGGWVGGGRGKTKLKLHSSQESWSWDELGKNHAMLYVSLLVLMKSPPVLLLPALLSHCSCSTGQTTDLLSSPGLRERLFTVLSSGGYYQQSVCCGGWVYSRFTKNKKNKTASNIRI